MGHGPMVMRRKFKDEKIKFADLKYACRTFFSNVLTNVNFMKMLRMVIVKHTFIMILAPKEKPIPNRGLFGNFSLNHLTV
jgi:hypothetical protein